MDQFDPIIEVEPPMFEPGDVVELKSSTVKMTVSAVVFNNDPEFISQYTYNVCWFNKRNELQLADFDEHELDFPAED